MGIERFEFYPRNHARATKERMPGSLAPQPIDPHVSLNSRSYSCSRNESLFLFTDHFFHTIARIRPACHFVSERIARFRYQRSEHLLAKLRPRKRNGNNASRSAIGTTFRRIITALDTEALDISVISVFRIVAYVLLVSAFLCQSLTVISLSLSV